MCFHSLHNAYLIRGVCVNYDARIPFIIEALVYSLSHTSMLHVPTAISMQVSDIC